MARYSLNFDRLTERSKAAAMGAGLGKACSNPSRALLTADDDALHHPDYRNRPAVADVEVREATGSGCTEAPRGILYHRYNVGDDGLITEAKIVPPTSQNQAQIEDDLKKLAPMYVDLPDDQLQWRCEQAIRNYDPCISCATHFLKIEKKEVSS